MQKGTTLLELMAVMAIGAMIMMGVVQLIFHEHKGTAIAKTSVTATHEIENAARWISQDGMMAENTNLTEGTDPVDYVVLTWTDRYDFANIPHSSSYYLQGTQLCRDYDGNVTVVARNISNIAFSQTGHTITVSVVCSPQWAGTPDKMVQKTYRVYLRTAESG